MTDVRLCIHFTKVDNLEKNMRFLFAVPAAFLAFALVAPATLAETVTNIGSLERGDRVTLQGEVTRILDEDEFRLQDATGSVRIYIGWRNRVMVDVGETVTVKGVVDDDLDTYFRPEVYAEEIILQDGRTVSLN